MNLYDNDAYREEFMKGVYELLSDDSDNFRANQIIDLFDNAPVFNPSNESLTIEQLREMVGEPVYDYLGQEWYIIQEYYDHELLMTDGTSFEDDDELDSVDERFYRRPPE